MAKKGAKKFSFKSFIPSIVVAEAYVVTPASTPFPKYWISDKEITGEIVRLKRAIQSSKAQLGKIREKLCKFRGEEQFKIIESHAMLLQDEMLLTQTVQTLSTQKINAEWAMEKTLMALKVAFSDMGEAYFEERKDDIEYVGRRILRNLQGNAEFNLDGLGAGKYILVTNDLSPADVASLPRDKVEGFITASGGYTSHTAIIARSMDIPNVLGRADIVNSITMGDRIVLDGVGGELIINPAKDSLAEYQKQRLKYKKLEERLIKTSHIPAKTKDGRTISIVANIELLEEVPSALEHGAEGVGLYRTEFLYANRVEYPTEKQLVENFSETLKKMAPRPVTIRTLDIGGDKLFYSGDYTPHVNPALGLRAIRFSLVEQELFITQLRALLQSNNYGNLRVMLPMVTDIVELRKVKKMINDIKKEFDKNGTPYNGDFELGIMIEVPSAVMMADALAKEADFFSIGTNDLIQFTLAIDRTNESVAHLFKPLHPAMIKMLQMTVTAARENGINVTLCGEMAGDPLYLMVLIGLGLDALSMNPISIPRVKQVVRKISYSDANALVEKLLKLSTSEEIEELVGKATIPLMSNNDNTAKA